MHYDTSKNRVFSLVYRNLDRSFINENPGCERILNSSILETPSREIAARKRAQ